MREVLKKFGRYFLLDQIAQGGMAEIYRARLAARDGAGRILVIKRIQASYGNNQEFLSMFKSEIKVTMGLSHPNIAQLFDYGSEDSLPYIAMEFVDGKNLRQFMARFIELRLTFPIEVAAYVIEQAACGLHYAHSYKDKITGESLNIIHRDISPQNILLSYDGNVKVIDFGIAKATVNSDFTRAGVIKGKPSYLSPEQISGDPLDGRCDIFALGTVLWELLAGKKLFSGENDLAVLKLIESAHTYVKPPSTVNPKVPKELDYIVLKALAKDPNKRYQTAGELQRALHKFIYSYMPDFDPSSLGYYAKDLFKNEIVDDRKLIQRLNDKVEQLLFGGEAGTGDLLMEDVSKKTQKTEDNTTTALEPVQKSTGAREAFQPETINNKGVQIELSTKAQSGTKKVVMEKSPAIPHSSRATGSANRPRTGNSGSSGSGGLGSAPVRRAPIQAGQGVDFGKLAFFVAAAVAAFAVVKPPAIEKDWFCFIPHLCSPAEAKLVLEGSAKNVVVKVDGQEVARALPATLSGVPQGKRINIEVLGQDGRQFRETVSLSKGESRTLLVVMADERAPASTPQQAPTQAPAEVPHTLLRLNIISQEGTMVNSPITILVNNKPVRFESPIISVPLNSPLLLIVDGARYRRLEREFTVTPSDVNASGEHVMSVELEELRFGRLTIRTSPSAAFATITGSDGRKWKLETPVEGIEFPVGTYEVRLESLVYDSKVVKNVKVEERKLIKVIEQLEIKN